MYPPMKPYCNESWINLPSKWLNSKNILKLCIDWHCLKVTNHTDFMCMQLVHCVVYSLVWQLKFRKFKAQGVAGCCSFVLFVFGVRIKKRDLNTNLKSHLITSSSSMPSSLYDKIIIHFKVLTHTHPSANTPKMPPTVTAPQKVSSLGQQHLYPPPSTTPPLSYGTHI